MALTITRAGDWLGSAGNVRTSTVTIAFDSSYDSGGEALTAANLGLGVIEHVTIMPKGGYVFEYDYTNSKVIVYVEEAVAAGGPLVEASGDLSLLTGVKVRATGR